MTRSFVAALASAALAAVAPLSASAAEPAPGVTLGTAPGEIATALAADGFRMTRYVVEAGGRIALTAIKDDRRLEVHVDGSTGEVVAVEERTRRGPSPLPGVDDAEVRARLEADGWRIERYERERGRIEVYAERDGCRGEIEIDARDGRILSVEEED